MAQGAVRPRIKYRACPLLMTSLTAAVYTGEPQQVQGCTCCLELVAEDLQDHNAYLGRCLHCRREITAQGGAVFAVCYPTGVTEETLQDTNLTE